MAGLVEKATKLNQDTLIPVSLVIVLLGGSFWLTTIYAQGIANAKAIDQEQSWHEKVDRRLGLIMGAMKIHDPEGHDD